MRLALVCRQIGHYHDARFRAAAERFEALTIVSTANEGGFSEFLARETGGYGVRRLFPDRAAFRRAVAEGAMPAAVRRELDDIRPDAVAVGGWIAPESLSAIRWARRRGVGVILMSDSQAFDAARKPLRERMKARIVRQCDAALVAGPTHRDYVLSLGMPMSRIQLGYDVIDNAHFAAGADAARADEAAQRRALGLPSRYVLASARFIAKKNLPRLVEAYGLALALNAGDGPDLVILGDGPDRPDLEALITRSGLGGRVHLPGFRGYDALPAFYGLAEAFAHVSTVEQWGLVINEAMASGVPVLVSKPCGAAALVQHGASGLLVDPHSPQDIAQALARLFRLSPQERGAMGRAGRKAIARWGPDRFADSLRAAAETAVAASRGRGMAPWDEALLGYLSRKLVEDVA